MNTPASFFQRLRDGGIQVVGFNPVNPLKAKGKWGLTHRDHRKILISDGKVAIIGGINISEVYSSSPFKRKKTKKRQFTGVTQTFKLKALPWLNSRSSFLTPG
jgi:cardiolipin synthase A/B